MTDKNIVKIKNKSLLNLIKQALSHDEIKHIVNNNLVITHCPRKVLGEATLIEHYVIFNSSGYLFFELDNLQEIIYFPFDKAKNDLDLSSAQYGEQIIFNKENDFVNKKRMKTLMTILNDPEVRRRSGGPIKDYKEKFEMIINQIKSEIETGLVKANIDDDLIKNKTTNTKHKI